MQSLMQTRIMEGTCILLRGAPHVPQTQIEWRADISALIHLVHRSLGPYFILEIDLDLSLFNTSDDLLTIRLINCKWTCRVYLLFMLFPKCAN